MRRAVHVARTNRDANKDQPETLTGGHKIITCRWEDNIEMVMKVTVEDVGQIGAAQVAGSSEQHSN